MKKRNEKFQGKLTLLIIILLSSCQGQAPLSSGEEGAKEQLRIAYEKLNQGDELGAEEALHTSITLDRANSSAARVALASIYAKKAGVHLKDWLDPFYQATQDIDTKNRTYRQGSELIDLTNFQLRHFYKEKYQNLTEEELEFRKRVASLTKSFAKLSLGIMVFVDVFQQMPTLDTTQAELLEKSIQILIEGNNQTYRLSEEGRMYLSVLSVVRLVNHIKRQMGREDILAYIKDPKGICDSNPLDLKEALLEIRKSIAYLQMGVKVYEDEPDNKRRKARKKISAFLEKNLQTNIWNKIENFFQEGTLEQKLGIEMSTDICHFILETNLGKKSETQNNQKILGGESNLFNPDED